MTPEQALDLLDQVAQTVNTNRVTHEKIVEAIKVLKAKITDPIKG